MARTPRATTPRARTPQFVDDTRRPRIVFGAGALTEVPHEVDLLAAQRVLLIATESVAGPADVITERLGSTVGGRIDRVAMHVPEDTVVSALQTASDLDADLLLALGGGSALGLAKALAHETGLPILAVPTTYAGSEMTSIWGQSSGGVKRTGRDPRVLPQTVVYDPVLTLDLPVPLSVTSGLNAVAHCVESLYAPDATQATTAMAGDGMTELVQSLLTIKIDPADLVARSGALLGASLAGRALESTQMGLHHVLCHALGGVVGLPHSQTHAALLPYVVSWNETAAGSSLAPARSTLSLSDLVGGSVGAALWDLNQKLGAPLNLATLGLTLSDIPSVARSVDVARIRYPRAASMADIQRILIEAHAGARPSICA